MVYIANVFDLETLHQFQIENPNILLIEQLHIIFFSLFIVI